MNRPVRTRMPGGVGEGAGNGPPYPIAPGPDARSPYEDLAMTSNARSPDTMSP